MATSGVVLDVGVVGAGIAGLAVASALNRKGHHVEIFERSTLGNEIGAAINIGPNAVPVLNQFGFNYERARALYPSKIITYDGSLSKRLYEEDLAHFKDDFGSPWMFFHRADLHNELKTLATHPPTGCPPVKLNLASPVADVDCEQGILTLQNGVTVVKDLIVGADGIHSVVADRVLQNQRTAIEVGECAFRFLIPTETLLKDPAAAPLFQQDRAFAFNMAISGDHRFVWYPCRGGHLQNFVVLHPAGQASLLEDFHARGNLQDLLDVVDNFHPSIKAICRLAEDLKHWKLIYRPPVSRWTRGKTILIGDAVHPMLPHQGQGGNQGVEDAGALGILLSNLRSLKDVPRRLEIVEAIRKDRTSALQIFSNAGQDQAHKIKEQAQQYVKGPIPSAPQEFHAWNFGYKILPVAQEALEAELAVNVVT